MNYIMILKLAFKMCMKFCFIQIFFIARTFIFSKNISQYTIHKIL